MDHPLYLCHVELNDGRTGTIFEVYDDGAAFLLELTGATCLDNLVTISRDDLDATSYLLSSKANADRLLASITLHERAIANGDLIRLTGMTSAELRRSLWGDE